MATTKIQESLREIIQIWQDRIICYPPKGTGYNAYLIDASTGVLHNYIHADCNTLRHVATNYDLLLVKITTEYHGYLKEAILNTIKYEATRRAFKKQHTWIHDSYQSLIEIKKADVDRHNEQIEQLKTIIKEQKQEITQLKNDCRNRLEQLQVEALLKQKEREIQQKDARIQQLQAQLSQRDREINNLNSEFQKGLEELKLKYKWLIAQFIKEQSHRQQEDRRNKSLKTCQNLFKKAQNKIKLLSTENNYLKEENYLLSQQLKVLTAKA
jgi:predicted RNase H-like nuclease (RuvC/YqgF family)